MEIGSPANDAGDEDNSLPALWELDSPEYECDCPGPPPPPFRIPPPPRPPFLSELPDCPEVVIADYESCDVMTVSTRPYILCFSSHLLSTLERLLPPPAKMLARFLLGAASNNLALEVVRQCSQEVERQDIWPFLWPSLSTNVNKLSGVGRRGGEGR